MGQAKNRGAYDERVTAVIARNGHKKRAVFRRRIDSRVLPVRSVAVTMALVLAAIGGGLL